MERNWGMSASISNKSITIILNELGAHRRLTNKLLKPPYF